MKKVYVSDTFSTNKIAAILQELYGDQAVVVTESSWKADDLMGQIVQENLSHREEEFSAKLDPKIAKEGVDLFFLSARAILDGTLNIKKLREKYGNADAKVVAMSVDEDYLDQVKKRNLGADFFHYKDTILSISSADSLGDNEKEELLSYFN